LILPQAGARLRALIRAHAAGIGRDPRLMPIRAAGRQAHDGVE